MIMPNIESDYFVGKPVKLNNNVEGFIVENPINPTSSRNNDKMELKVKLKN